MIRIESVHYPDCTLGRLYFEDFQCFTLELPWLNNKPNISCIPAGRYEYFKRTSSKNGEVLQLKGTEPRTYIQLHSGNYTRQIQGCILPGDSIKFLDNDSIPDVTNSKNTLNKILTLVPSQGIIQIRRAS